jgi:hypothetical protein
VFSFCTSIKFQLPSTCRAEATLYQNDHICFQVPDAAILSTDPREHPVSQLMESLHIVSAVYGYQTVHTDTQGTIVHLDSRMGPSEQSEITHRDVKEAMSCRTKTQSPWPEMTIVGSRRPRAPSTGEEPIEERNGDNE